MKKAIFTLLFALFILASCKSDANLPNGSKAITVDTQSDEKLVGIWIDLKTEGMVEYTADGFYYEIINEIYTTDKTRYIATDGKIYYYLDGDDLSNAVAIDYEIKNNHLIIAGEIEYKPIDINTSAEETN